METNYIPKISISPAGIAIYREMLPRLKFSCITPEDGNFPTPEQCYTPPRQNTPDGIMSVRAKKRINNAIKWLLFMSREKKQYSRDQKKWIKFRITFITLTLASDQRHPDQEIKSRLLNSMLTEMPGLRDDPLRVASRETGKRKHSLPHPNERVHPTFHATKEMEPNPK